MLDASQENGYYLNTHYHAGRDTHDTAGAVRRFVETQRLRRVVGETEPTYRYQGDVETFFRHSSAVVRTP